MSLTPTQSPEAEPDRDPDPDLTWNNDPDPDPDPGSKTWTCQHTGSLLWTCKRGLWFTCLSVHQTSVCPAAARAGSRMRTGASSVLKASTSY